MRLRDEVEYVMMKQARTQKIRDMCVCMCVSMPRGRPSLQWVLELSAFMWKVLLSPLISVAGLPFHWVSIPSFPLFFLHKYV